MVSTAATLSTKHYDHICTKVHTGHLLLLRLVRHELLLVNPCWLFPLAFWSSMCLDIASRRFWSHCFPGNWGEDDYSVVPQTVLLPLVRETCGVCLIPDIRNFLWAPQPFEDGWEWPCNDIGQLPQHHWHPQHPIPWTSYLLKWSLSLSFSLFVYCLTLAVFHKA